MRVGDTLDGWRVTGLDRQAMTLSGGGQLRRIAMSDNFDLVPLNRDAAYLGGRETPHNDDAADVAFTKVVALEWRRPGSLVAVASDSEDMQKLQNDVFDGKITQQEFDRRTAGVNQTVTLVDNLGDEIETTSQSAVLEVSVEPRR